MDNNSLYEVEKDKLIDLIGYEGRYMINVDNQNVFTLIKDKYLKCGATDGHGYRILNLYNETGKNRKMHRIHRIFYQSYHKLKDSDMEGKDIDHIDGNRLNNTIDNLRLCSHKQNMMNKQKNKTKKGLKNLYKFKNTFKVSFRVDKKIIQKYFKTFNEACVCVINTRKQLHQDYANWEDFFELLYPLNNEGDRDAFNKLDLLSVDYSKYEHLI